jgi:hypothetical protein
MCWIGILRKIAEFGLRTHGNGEDEKKGYLYEFSRTSNTCNRSIGILHIIQPCASRSHPA